MNQLYSKGVEELAIEEPRVSSGILVQLEFFCSLIGDVVGKPSQNAHLDLQLAEGASLVEHLARLHRLTLKNVLLGRSLLGAGLGG